jgi:hypothetical protein
MAGPRVRVRPYRSVLLHWSPRTAWVIWLDSSSIGPCPFLRYVPRLGVFEQLLSLSTRTGGAGRSWLAFSSSLVALRCMGDLCGRGQCLDGSFSLRSICPSAVGFFLPLPSFTWPEDVGRRRLALACWCPGSRHPSSSSWMGDAACTAWCPVPLSWLPAGRFLRGAIHFWLSCLRIRLRAGAIPLSWSPVARILFWWRSPSCLRCLPIRMQLSVASIVG